MPPGALPICPPRSRVPLSKNGNLSNGSGPVTGCTDRGVNDTDLLLGIPRHEAPLTVQSHQGNER